MEDEDLNKLLDNLPFFIQEYVYTHANKDNLMEIIMDLGRRPEGRFSTGPEYLSQKIISWQDLDYTTKRISKFSNENRAGIERTLHRISCIRNRQFLINGLTCRIGRAIFGTICIIRDLLESGQSILILGEPGVGKTTIIREIARVLADEMGKRVIIIDTSNEIAGDSDIPHFGIGRARRMQVSEAELQHQVMIEAIENHMPQIIIIDEIGSELETLAARTIAEKGVQLVGTAHGNCLENVIKNPSLSELVGGIQYVTLSDDEAKRRGTQKSILERKSYPAFQVAIEINSPRIWTIYENIRDSIDLLLRGNLTVNQLRYSSHNDKINIKYKNFYSSFWSNNSNNSFNNWFSLNYLKNQYFNYLNNQKLVIYPYSLSKNLFREVMNIMGFKFILTKNINKASIVIGLKRHLYQNQKLQTISNQKRIPIYVLHQVTLYQIIKLIKFIILE